ncbi:hypothetical protein IT575_15405 [bacterium]|nr:hypothetical protein [bacterium]
MLRMVGIALACSVLLIGGAVLFAVAADPGSKDDPLVTQSYVRGLASFKRTEVPAKRGLRLAPGAEFVLLDPAEPTSAPGLDPRKSVAVNLSSGERLTSSTLEPFQHYVNGGSGDLFLKFNTNVTLLLKGEWK